MCANACTSFYITIMIELNVQAEITPSLCPVRSCWLATGACIRDVNVAWLPAPWDASSFEDQVYDNSVSIRLYIYGFRV